MCSQGYAPDEKARLVRALTDAIRFVVPAPDEAITVMLSEYPAENYARGGQMRQPAPALPDPAKLVLRYLERHGGARSRHGAARCWPAGSR
jgi:phenylpyruvate tautomerase PptA (4-oxalocrotonate tautomerase family)